MSIQKARRKIGQLVRKFEQEKALYLSSQYNETNARKQFIDSFWEALDWDLGNIHEVELSYPVEIGHREHLKFADYTFKISERPVFVVEAKKPATDLKNKDVVFQVKRYGFNMQTVNFAVLTDFEEFRLFDCGLEPVYSNPQRGLQPQFDLVYNQYLDRCDLLYDTFSRDAVSGGSLDKLLPKARQKARQRIPLNKAFFNDLYEWRKMLAVDLAKRNPFDEYQLNEAVQLLIDRIIFMRVVEDRQIEPTELVLDALNRWQRERERPFYQYLVDKFHWMEPQYNGLLFRASPYDDMLLDDKLLRQFVESLYYPNTPYQFNIIGVDLLGNVYEQFLGSTITVKETAKRRTAQVEPKPEVRKAGGVYYTPQYIVDYIVGQTVGKVIAGKTPKEIEKIRILDPACGSGSFLIGAFQKLIDYHQQYYAKRAKQNKLTRKERIEDFDTRTGQLQLKRKVRILKNNIYGVDIDFQAVEVTILSLYLKLLEGDQSLFLIKQSILPDLSDNIRCGNSFIGPDFYDDVQIDAFDLKEQRRINVFDWKSKTHGFGYIMEEGGFDCVIGNPPYILLQNLPNPDLISKYSKVNYRSAQYKIDIYHMFLEKGILLLTEKGRLGYITPNTYLMNKFTNQLRQFILDHVSIRRLVLIPEKVFPDASVDTCVSLFERQSDRHSRRSSVIRVINVWEGSLGIESNQEIHEIEQDGFYTSEERFFNVNVKGESVTWAKKVEAVSIPLGSFANAYFGIQTFNREKYVSNRRVDKSYKPTLDGGDIHRYLINPRAEYVNFTKSAIKSGGNQSVYEQPKIVVRQIGREPIAAYDDQHFFSLNTVYNIYLKRPLYDLKHVLGILNSKMMQKYWNLNFSDHKATFPKIKKAPLHSIPIRKLHLSNAGEKNLHDRMVTLVDAMLDLHKQLQTARTETDKRQIQTRIEHTDRQIDQLVYELYGLTEREIKIVEESVES